MRRVLVTLLIAIVSISQQEVAAAAPAQNQTSFAARVMDLTNAERQKAGLTPLTLSPQLEEAALDYSQVLASSGCFGHTCGPVPNFIDRDDQAGYSRWTNIGENVAEGYSSPEDVVAAWMASPGHRANILSPAYTEIGIGVTNTGAEYGTYWAQEFGSREAAADQVAAGAAGDPISDAEN